MKYQEITKNDGRVFVVGDIHGDYDKLMNLMEEVSFDKDSDLLIATGDLIDRGRKNLECLQLTCYPWFKSVMGNHEEMAYKGLINFDQRYMACWLGNGGGWYDWLPYDQKAEARLTIQLIPEVMPHVIELNRNGKKYVICHGDYPSSTYEFGKDVDAGRLLWSRIEYDLLDGGVTSFNPQIDGADLFIFGHTPAEAHPVKFGNRTYVDTGNFFSGKLFLGEIETLL